MANPPRPRRLLGPVLMVLAACASQQLLRPSGREMLDEFSTLVSETVQDSQRRSIAEARIRGMKEALDLHGRRVEQLARDLFELHADYDSDRAAFEAAFDRIYTARQSTSDLMIEEVIRLRRALTSAEWTEVYEGMAKYRDQ